MTNKKKVSLFIDRNTTAYFDPFGIEYIPQDVLKKIKDKSINHNIFRTETYDDSIICGFYCVTFIEIMIEGKTEVDNTNILSPNDYQKNDKLLYDEYFKNIFGRRKRVNGLMLF